MESPHLTAPEGTLKDTLGEAPSVSRGPVRFDTLLEQRHQNIPPHLQCPLGDGGGKAQLPGSLEAAALRPCADAGLL